MNGDKRYHAEVKIELEGRECRINAFRDTLQEIFQDIGTICTQFPQDWMNPAKREIVNAERKAAQLRGPAGKPAAKPNFKQLDHDIGKAYKAAGIPDEDELFGKETGEIPVCENCGSSEFMELIEFADKKTGAPRKAWKCQKCEKWHWPNGKKG